MFRAVFSSFSRPRSEQGITGLRLVYGILAAGLIALALPHVLSLWELGQTRWELEQAARQGQMAAVSAVKEGRSVPKAVSSVPTVRVELNTVRRGSQYCVVATDLLPNRDLDPVFRGSCE